MKCVMLYFVCVSLVIYKFDRRSSIRPIGC